MIGRRASFTTAIAFAAVIGTLLLLGLLGGGSASVTATPAERDPSGKTLLG